LNVTTEPHHASSTAAETYRTYMPVLVRLAARKYQIPRVDAESVAHDVFINYLSSAAPVENTRAYLMVGMCRACVEYWRVQNRDLPLPRNLDERPSGTAYFVPELIASRTARQVLDALNERCRRSLQLRYLDELSMREVAERLHMTVRYAEKIVAKCLRYAYELWIGLQKRA
jgi:RNA polymerase sigma factor (sigma-70 family)